MRDATRIAGLAGTVLFLFGLVSYALTGAFDLWTAVHVATGGVLIAVAVLLNLAGFRRSVALRGTRERARVLAGTVLFAAILVSVNVVAARRPLRYDATENKVHTLSAKTLAVLNGLQAPVEVLAFLQPGDAGREDLAELLDRFAAACPRVTWRFVDPEREPQLADQLGVRHKGTLAARSGKTTAEAPAEGGGAFSEGQITTLLLRVGRPASKVVYFLVGHGEPAIDDATSGAGLGVLAEALRAENFEPRPLDLTTAAGVPADARVVVVAGPVKPLLGHEVVELRKFLGGGGRALLLIDPGTKPGLDPILADYRIAIGDDMIVDQEEVPFLGARIGVDPIIKSFRPHPITREFKERIVLFQARSVGLREEGGIPGVRPQLLAETGPAAWAESGYKDMLATGRVRQPERTSGPVGVAAASKGPLTGAAGESDGARLVVVGDSDLALNENLGAYFNREFLVNVFQWLAGSEDLIAELPRTLRPSRLDMTEADYRNLFRFGVLFLPEALLIVGIAVWWRRRLL